ncbi:MAG: hybrid sensor histidine kinase/response regulator [Alphaproteobacteria bacterium]|nr:MAG: hybrid sensor histidine kinase/response regulator [Alphaproteobacteria bacterium]
MDDLLSEFLTETAESLDVVDAELVRFENCPDDKATLNNIFRLVHTIKGTCGFIGLPRLESLAHAGETLLGKFRDGALDVTPAAVTLILASIDRIKTILAHLADTQTEPAGDDRDLIAQLEDAAEGGLQSSLPPPVVVKLEPKQVTASAAAEQGDDNGRWDADQGRYLRPGEVSLAELEAAFRSTDGPEVAEAKPVAAAIAAPAEPDEDRKSGLGPSTIRVNVDVLESMMTMVSELVLTRNQLMQMLRATSDSEFKSPLQRLSGITAELQDCVMKTRMQPIGSAWKKLPRIVRDAGQDLAKKLDLVMEGEETELDRQVLELIKDPLTHMIRNSCDHGVETPAERVAAGKSETGTIKLRAYHEGGHIIIELSDDGAGLKTDRIRAKALEKGVIDAAEAMTMTDAQIHRLIFAPGFSTAAKVTNISGRGVGMDVVKTNVELIGGAIDLKSRQGAGTTFSIKIPLTLAIIKALIVGVGEHRFAMPQLSVLELVRTGKRCEHKIEQINSTRILCLRDRLLPLVALSDILGLADIEENDHACIVVMQVGDTRFGLVVDEVFDTEEIVVKPLSKRLGSMSVYSGATILGDGAVIMILDPNGVAKSVSGADRAASRAMEDAAARSAGAASKGEGERTSLLLFTAGTTEPRACPLSLVTRLEEFDASTFEKTARGQVVQYRGRLMPLAAAGGSIRTEGRQPILVFSQGDVAIGLAVDAILDIVEERLDIQLSDNAPGILGTAVLKGRSTEVIDVSHYLSEAEPGWAMAASQVETTRVKKRVLLVDAHPFFRNMLAPMVSAAGYDVTVAADLQEARGRLAQDAAYDVVLADADATAPDSLAEVSSARIVPLSNRRDSDAVPKSDRTALLDAIERAIRFGEAA